MINSFVILSARLRAGSHVHSWKYVRYLTIFFDRVRIPRISKTGDESDFGFKEPQEAILHEIV